MAPKKTNGSKLAGNGRLTSEQYEDYVRKVGLSVRSAGKFFDVNERTSRRWAAEMPPPVAVSKLLRLMIKMRLQAGDVH